jgi:rSAM/selenodomain-associated transferase 2
MDDQEKKMKISVVIPTFNEEDNISRTISKVINQPGIVEVIIVDGGSIDNTISIAQNFDVKIISSGKGRGEQLDKGWREAEGDIIWFLHADTFPQKIATEQIFEAFKNRETALTAFYLDFGASQNSLRLIEYFTNIRSLFLKLPYGDQGIAVRRKNLAAINGLPNWPNLEDVYLVSQMKSYGKIQMLQSRVLTSSRRYEKKGIWLTVIRHIRIMIHWWIYRRPLEGIQR